MWATSAEAAPPPQPRPLAAAALPGGLAWGSQEAAAPQPRPRPLPGQLAAPIIRLLLPPGGGPPPASLPDWVRGHLKPHVPEPHSVLSSGLSCSEAAPGQRECTGRAQAAAAQRPQVGPRGEGLVRVCRARAPRRSSTSARAQPAPATRGSPNGVILAIPACNRDKEPRSLPKAGSRWAAEQRRRLH